ncbi:ATP-binding protein [Pseudonocardia sp.]|uniref:ATP-binding protein n=1 Tax=Pseudonocardia sp. TaxID=60912 RepID=UPI003D0D922A
MPERRATAGRATVAGRVAAARRGAFVGRKRELELFRHAVELPAGAEPPFAVLHVHGPGGIGKSALLRMYGDLARAAGATVVRVDGRDTPDPHAIRDAALTPADGRLVLLVDAYELLGPLDGWVREELVPALPGDALTVLAGREPPSRGWLDDPAWRALSRVVGLGTLDAAEAADLLAAAELPTEVHTEVLTLARGHPLALTVAAELATRPGDQDRAVGPALLETLVPRLVDTAPTPRHRDALRVCSCARTTTEALLRELVPGDGDGPGPAELFDWLRTRAWVENGERGLVPHDLVRDVLVADLRRRDPEAAATLRHALREHTVRRARAAGGARREQAMLDLVFEFRHVPHMATWYDWSTFGLVRARPVAPDELDALRELVVGHVGERDADAVLAWVHEQPEGVVVIGDHGRVDGVLVSVSLHDASPRVLAADPIAARAREWATAQGLRADHEVTAVRFLAHRVHGERRSPMHDVVAVRTIRETITRPNLAFDIHITADPAFNGPLLLTLGLDRVPELDTVQGTRDTATYALDVRTRPSNSFSDIVGGPAPGTAVVDPDTVRAALRDLHRPDRLAVSPLAVAAGTTGDEVRAALLAAIDTLRTDPRDARLHRVLDRTFVRPAGTQEKAAELLGLPFSTYRRHLAAATARVAELLATVGRN